MLGLGIRRIPVGAKPVATLTMVFGRLKLGQGSGPIAMTNQFRLSVGQRIREMREVAGYRIQREFARELGISASELSRIERGLRRLDTVLLRRIAEKLNTTMDAFFTDGTQMLALARAGDADSDSMQRMVAWAEELRADINRVAEYVEPSVR
jgi:transcriptional regulator with XRE-family HTH domain